MAVAPHPEPPAERSRIRARRLLASLLAAGALGLGAPGASADAAFFFSTGSPDAKMAIASRPAGTGIKETEAADDFVLADQTALSGASFTGLLPGGTQTSAIQQVVVELYRVFPQDSDTTRTPNVPTRTNSPSDVGFATREAGNGLTFTAAVVSTGFTALNSVDAGIHPQPPQTTGGEGPVTGSGVTFNVAFDPPLQLPPGHWFFVPQVALSGGEHFFWLSAPKPIVAGTPFTPDLQAWVRNADLEPDWLRVGTDVVGGSPAPTFNAAFSLSGTDCVLDPSTCPTTPPGGGGGGGSGGGGAGAGGSGGAGTGGSDTTASPSLPAPQIGQLKLVPAAFRAASHGAGFARRRRARPPVGTTISYTDTRAAAMTIAVLKPLRGVRSGGGCRRRTRGLHGRRCTLYRALGHIVHADVQGANRLRFSGRVNGRALAPGAYRLRLTPRAGTLTGRTVSAAFRIVR